MSNITDEKLVADLRHRGLVGPIDQKFIDEYRRHREFAEALDQMQETPDGVEMFKRALIRCRILPNPDPTDSALDAAWERFKSAEIRLEETGPDADDETDAPIWNEWNAAAATIAETPANTAAGALVKLRRALLLMESQGWVSRAMSTGDDTTLFARAEQLECTEQLVVDAIAALSGDPHVGSQTAFDAALAEYQRLRAIELAIPGATVEEEEAHAAEQQAAIDATTKAFNAMIVIPVEGGRQAAAKLRAIGEFYDLGAGGLDRNVLGQVLAEVDRALCA